MPFMLSGGFIPDHSVLTFIACCIGCADLRIYCSLAFQVMAYISSGWYGSPPHHQNFVLQIVIFSFQDAVYAVNSVHCPLLKRSGTLQKPPLFKTSSAVCTNRHHFKIALFISYAQKPNICNTCFSIDRVRFS